MELAHGTLDTKLEETKEYVDRILGELMSEWISNVETSLQISARKRDFVKTSKFGGNQFITSLISEVINECIERATNPKVISDLKNSKTMLENNNLGEHFKLEGDNMIRDLVYELIDQVGTPTSSSVDRDFGVNTRVSNIQNTIKSDDDSIKDEGFNANTRESSIKSTSKSNDATLEGNSTDSMIRDLLYELVDQLEPNANVIEMTQRAFHLTTGVSKPKIKHSEENTKPGNGDSEVLTKPRNLEPETTNRNIEIMNKIIDEIMGSQPKAKTLTGDIANPIAASAIMDQLIASIKFETEKSKTNDEESIINQQTRSLSKKAAPENFEFGSRSCVAGQPPEIEEDAPVAGNAMGAIRYLKTNPLPLSTMRSNEHSDRINSARICDTKLGPKRRPAWLLNNDQTEIFHVDAANMLSTMTRERTTPVGDDPFAQSIGTGDQSFYFEGDEDLSAKQADPITEMMNANRSLQDELKEALNAPGLGLTKEERQILMASVEESACDNTLKSTMDSTTSGSRKFQTTRSKTRKDVSSSGDDDDDDDNDETDDEMLKSSYSSDAMSDKDREFDDETLSNTRLVFKTDGSLKRWKNNFSEGITPKLPASILNKLQSRHAKPKKTRKKKSAIVK